MITVTETELSLNVTDFPSTRFRSWQRGDRRHPAVPDQLYGNVGRAFAAKGLVGIVMSYRLAPGVQHPEQVRDVAREFCTSFFVSILYCCGC